MTSCNSILNAPDNTEADSQSQDVSETDEWSGGGIPYYSYTMSPYEYNEFIAKVNIPDYVPTYEELSYFGELSEVKINGPLRDYVSSVGELIDQINYLKRESLSFNFYNFDITYKFVGYEEMFLLSFDLFRYEGKTKGPYYDVYEKIEDLDVFKIDMEKHGESIDKGAGVLNEAFGHEYLENGYLKSLCFLGGRSFEDAEDGIEGYYECKIIFLYDESEENGKAIYTPRYDMSNRELNYFLSFNTMATANAKMNYSNIYGVEEASNLFNDTLERNYKRGTE